MNRGVELLIARMKSNPEEFKPNEYVVGGSVNGVSKWENLLHNWRHCLTEEELKAFQDALKETHRELFSQEVMKHILRKGEKEVSEVIIDEYQHPYNTGITSAQGAFTANNIKVGSQTLDEEMVRLMKEQLKQYKATGKI